MDVDITPTLRASGVTLIELLTIVAVVGISLATLGPGWSQMVKRNQITVRANQLLTHLQYARNQALTRGAFVTLCPSTDGQHCSGDPRGWHQGYLVFEDTDGNRRRDDGETLLRRQDATSGSVQVHSTQSRPAVRFGGDGSAWSSNTTFSVCHGGAQDGHANRAVILYGSGRARVDRRAPGNRAVRCT